MLACSLLWHGLQDSAPGARRCTLSSRSYACLRGAHSPVPSSAQWPRSPAQTDLASEAAGCCPGLAFHLSRSALVNVPYIGFRSQRGARVPVKTIAKHPKFYQHLACWAAQACGGEPEGLGHLAGACNARLHSRVARASGQYAWRAQMHTLESLLCLLARRPQPRAQQHPVATQSRADRSHVTSCWVLSRTGLSPFSKCTGECALNRLSKPAGGPGPR